MKIHRDEIVERLRAMGRDDDADRALAELPDPVNLVEYEGTLQSYGLDADWWRQQRMRGLWFTNWGAS